MFAAAQKYIRHVERDFARSRTMTLDDVKAARWWIKALARACYLISPVQ